jgi:hypothetical protein
MFQGSLSEIKLPDIIQLLSTGGKTGVFQIQHRNKGGQIWLENGQITHAQTENLQGEHAIFAMAVWSEGAFEFVEGKTTDIKSVQKHNAHILIEVGRKLDEWRVLSKRIPSLDLIPEVADLTQKTVSFNTQEWSVLSKINGVDSISQIADQSQIFPIDAAKLLYGLVANGMIKLRDTPKGAPDQNPLQQAQESPVSADDQKHALLDKIERIYQVSKIMLGDYAHKVIQRHCAKGVKDVDQGKGLSAVIDTATNILKATNVLEGPVKTKALTAELKKIIRSKP